MPCQTVPRTFVCQTLYGTVFHYSFEKAINIYFLVHNSSTAFHIKPGHSLQIRKIPWSTSLRIQFRKCAQTIAVLNCGKHRILRLHKLYRMNAVRTPDSVQHQPLLFLSHICKSGLQCWGRTRSLNNISCNLQCPNSRQCGGQILLRQA